MIKTNEDTLVSQKVLGKISHPILISDGGYSGSYSISWDGKPTLGVGLGGIKYNVKVGDSCFGWAEADSVEPGVALIGFEESPDAIGAPGSQMPATAVSFHSMSCVGNEVEIIEGDGKGAKGVVTGKDGYADIKSHVLSYFEDDDLEKLTIGDKVCINAKGLGLKIDGFEGEVFNVSPEFLKNLGLTLEGGSLNIPVVMELPSLVMGLGVGGRIAPLGHWCIQTNPPPLVREFNLDKLRIGDLVAVRDIRIQYGKGYHRGAITIGIIAYGASERAGQGPGIFAMAVSKNGKIIPRIDPDANVARFLKLRS